MNIRDENESSLNRKKRVNRIKKIIIALCILLVTIPIVLCIFLLVKMNDMEKRLDSLISIRENEEEIIIEVKGEAAPEKIAGTVYLTFDDGPSMYTEEILEVLDSYDIKATFFVIGKEDEKSKKLYKEIYNRGHSLGIHTYTHDFSETYASVEKFSSEIKRMETLIQETTGETTLLFRFPGGSSTPRMLRYGHSPEDFIDYLNMNGYTYFDWNVSSGDGNSITLDTETIIRNVVDEVVKNKSSIVLMHDAPNKGTTVEALPEIINQLMEKGYRFNPLDKSVAPVQHIPATITEKSLEEEIK